MGNMSWLFAGVHASLIFFAGGSTAMGFSQLQDNLGNMTIVVDEACICFPHMMPPKVR